MARVYRDGTLIFTLQTNDRLISATAQAGTIHAPTAAKAIPVNEGDYQPPQIWPVPPYVTLFAWPHNQGIGVWDQIFEPDPNARVLTLAETQNGVLDTWECPGWQSAPSVPAPTETPTPPAPTAIPSAPTVTPTETPVGPTPTPTETPVAPTATPTITATPTATPTVAPTVTPTVNPCLVTTQADNVTTPPAGSLRQVLANNPCCTTITFTNAVNTITLAGVWLGVPDTCTNLIIDGSGGAGGHVTISGNDASGVMWVTTGSNVTLNALTITNGNESSFEGGGIMNQMGGTLTLTTSTTISNNTAHNGGGIRNYGTLIVNGTVNNNTATNSGGGICNAGTLILTSSSTVSGNTADSDGGGISNVGVLTVDGIVSNNSAVLGGGIFSQGATLTVDGIVNNNTAIYGGGICNYGGNGTLILTGTVSNNTADMYGGGIWNVDGTLTLNPGHLIQGNHSDNDNTGGETGGGIYTDVICPAGANYGIAPNQNFRGSGTGTIDNCNGNP